MGLDFVAIADHNAIGHVPLALRAGEEFEINVVPAVEIQTREDIHLLCLFERYDDLEKFFSEIPFSERKNREELFGEQLYFDEDDNIIGKEDRMLLDSAAVSCDDVRELAESWRRGDSRSHRPRREQYVAHSGRRSRSVSRGRAVHKGNRRRKRVLDAEKNRSYVKRLARSGYRFRNGRNRTRRVHRFSADTRVAECVRVRPSNKY